MQLSDEQLAALTDGERWALTADRALVAVDHLLATIADLRIAPKPFAEIDFECRCPDDEIIEILVALSDLRRAAKALEEK